MRFSARLLRDKERIVRLLIVGLIAAGVLMRAATFLHNRDLIIDEANIVRNLAERGFAGLSAPLSYEQYAPPVFLWIEKLVSLVAGYGEEAMRFYPLVCGMGAMFLFPLVARRLMRDVAVLLPLAYLAAGFIFIRYSAEVKQYMPDTLITLLLLWLALRWDFNSMPRRRFVVCWIGAGSLAIWSSMPSVFILAGVGCYYVWPLVRERRWRNLKPILFIGAVWVAQFALYYKCILKEQINSPYLQNFHHDYFLDVSATSLAVWEHNWERIQELLGAIGGWSGVAIVVNLLLLLLGITQLFIRRGLGVTLVAMPVALVLTAAALRQFSLIDRVVLFMLPLWLILIGLGFERLWQYRWRPLQAALVIVGGFNVVAMPHNVMHPYNNQEITKGMAWLNSRGALGEQLYLHDAAVPAYIYYTELHPQKACWQPLLGAHRLSWEDDYARVTERVRDTVYLLTAGGFEGTEQERRLAQMAAHLSLAAQYHYAACSVRAYVPKAAQLAATSSGTTPN